MGRTRRGTKQKNWLLLGIVLLISFFFRLILDTLLVVHQLILLSELVLTV